MRILVMGGTRFIGVYLTQILVEQGHDVVLFNRGNKPAPVEGVQQIHGDRKDAAQLKQQLSGESFDAIFDNNGRELSDTQPLVEIFNGQVQHFVYVSSAGVYLKTDQLPHREGDAVDPNSRHKGKFATEEYLTQQQVPFTSVRPVYIYGPQNHTVGQVGGARRLRRLVRLRRQRHAHHPVRTCERLSPGDGIGAGQSASHWSDLQYLRRSLRHL